VQIKDTHTPVSLCANQRHTHTCISLCKSKTHMHLYLSVQIKDTHTHLYLSVQINSRFFVWACSTAITHYLTLEECVCVHLNKVFVQWVFTLESQMYWYLQFLKRIAAVSPSFFSFFNEIFMKFCVLLVYNLLCK